jgi:negative regulator of replication initiation
VKIVRISDDVYHAIAREGHFGETVDDVLRRKYGVPQTASPSGARRRLALRTMSAKVEGDQFVVRFAGGPTRRWALPTREDKAGIKAVLNEAVAFARLHEATLGQVNAVRKALTEAGFHLTK